MCTNLEGESRGNNVFIWSNDGDILEDDLVLTLHYLPSSLKQSEPLVLPHTVLIQ